MEISNNDLYDIAVGMGYGGGKSNKKNHIIWIQKNKDRVTENDSE
jgi:hypothetical protein